MPTVNEIRNRCLAWAQPDWKEEWDNVGLLCGSAGAEVSKLLVALDVTMAVAKEAAEWGAELIVSHHPLLFSTDNLSDETPDGALLLYLAQNRIAVISLHTNLDSAPGGVRWCCDGSVFCPRSDETVVFGPGSIKQGHATVEFIATAELEAASDALARLLAGDAG